MGLFCQMCFDLNLLQTEAVSVLSVVETTVVNHSLLKTSKNRREKALKSRGQVSQEDISGWSIPPSVWESERNGNRGEITKAQGLVLKTSVRWLG